MPFGATPSPRHLNPTINCVRSRHRRWPRVPRRLCPSLLLCQLQRDELWNFSFSNVSAPPSAPRVRVTGHGRNLSPGLSACLLARGLRSRWFRFFAPASFSHARATGGGPGVLQIFAFASCMRVRPSSAPRVRVTGHMHQHQHRSRELSAHFLAHGQREGWSS